MKYFYILIISSLFSVNEIKAQRQVILIIADDLGYKDVGFNGSTYYETPNLDAFATKSLNYTRAYSNASNCAPSRACLMTGSYSSRHGVFTVSPPDRGNERTRKLISTKNSNLIPENFKTLGNLFEEAGFKTAVMGKWHIGENPLKQGFNEHKGGGKAGHPKSYFSPYNLTYLEDGPENENLTDRITTESINFIIKNKNEDFFLYLPYFAIHTPLQGKKEMVEKYKNKPIKNGQGSEPAYAALVENLDQNIGRILTAIKDANLKDPLIIFTSDNGGIASLSRQWPLRGGKGSYYEGGIRVPLLVNHRSINAGYSSTPTQLFDLFPTLCEFFSVSVSNSQIIDGESMVKDWKSEPSTKLKDRSLYFYFPFYLQQYRGILDDNKDPLFRTRPGAVIIQNNWKLHYYFEDLEYELYNLEQDPGERINLVNINKTKFIELRNLLNNWQETTNSPVLVKKNPKYDDEYSKKLLSQ